MATSSAAETPAPALKEMFDAARYRSFADHLTDLVHGFDRKRFLKQALDGLPELSLMQRLRRTTECLRTVLPDDFGKAVAVLRKLAPRLEHGFVGIVLSDYVALYGLDHFDEAMAALAHFTQFGSAEFAVREFLRRDLKRSLAIMKRWSIDENEHVRRLASEGSRPRLPWSFRLDALVQDPSPALPILERLNDDPSLYVRKSVANHLNDITKDHPAWVMDQVEGWPLTRPGTAWIVKRALRTLIKAGDARALKIVGAGGKPEIEVSAFVVSPRKLQLGERLSIACEFRSTAEEPQRLIVDYAVHYVKKSGAANRKVFKWKELTLPPGKGIELSRRQMVKNFTTRVHHAGLHRVELLINGEIRGEGAFDLKC